MDTAADGAPRFAAPIVLDLHGVPVLVVGAGRVAATKVDSLAAAGAAVVVVAVEVSPAVERALGAGRVHRLERRPYRADDLDGVRLVVTATGDHEVDATVARDAGAAGLWVNAADRRELCSFILPAIARRGPLSIAVSTDGASPALARRLRDRAGELLTPDVVALAARLADERAAIHDAGGSTEGRDWSALIDPVLDTSVGRR